MDAPLRDFDRKAWFQRFGQALEAIAAEARPSGVPLNVYGAKPAGWYRREKQRRYRDMAILARTNALAAKLFDESGLWLDELPDGIHTLLLEHPVLRHAWSGESRGNSDAAELVAESHTDVKFFVSHLAKLSLKVGGIYAATLLHRFLVAGHHVRLHATEITVLHGLALDAPITLGGGAYLASYESVRKRFGLPHDPEPWIRPREGQTRQPSRVSHESSLSVLVRKFSWGFKSAPFSGPMNPHGTRRLRHWFPEDHRVDSHMSVGTERQTLLQLLSIAVRSSLVSHSVITALPPWMRLINPNLRTANHGGNIGLFDVWPEDKTPTATEIDAYVQAARGWLSSHNRSGGQTMDLAIRRTAASFGIAPGRFFGREDRIIDASVALEAMYGPFGTGEITNKISLRAAWLLGQCAEERRKIFDDMKSFYKVRSGIVHGNFSAHNTGREQQLYDALAVGRELSRRSLFALIALGRIKKEDFWNRLVLDGATPKAD